MYVESCKREAVLKHPEMTGLSDIQDCLREGA